MHTTSPNFAESNFMKIQDKRTLDICKINEKTSDIEIIKFSESTMNYLTDLLTNNSMLPADNIQIKNFYGLNSAAIEFVKDDRCLQVPINGLIDINMVFPQLHKFQEVKIDKLTYLKIMEFHSTRAIPLACEIADDLYKLYN